MEYRINENGDIEVKIEAKNSGKFRFKKRDNNFSFGEVFSTRDKVFTEQTYLEWQISYDIPIDENYENDHENELNRQYFVASSGKRKYPAELSELFYKAIKQRLISKERVENLFKEIIHYKEFIDKKTINIEENISEINLNNVMNFKETSIKLPTLFMDDTSDGTQIEVSIKQQQYASGVQPMVYFCIPIMSFINSSSLLGKSSKSHDFFTYIINTNNSENLLNLMRIFGMASERHNHDIIEIIKIILLLI